MYPGNYEHHYHLAPKDLLSSLILLNDLVILQFK